MQKSTYGDLEIILDRDISDVQKHGTTNSKKNRWAKDYEFEKHVDDLREESGASRARTDDLNTASVALFQLSYSPTSNGSYPND
jgi:hypothetical protein